MKKEKIHLEYLLNSVSRNILWTAISTPMGLENWFADRVLSDDDKIAEFQWGKTERRKAEIVAIRSYSFIRFHWLDDDEKDYFEIRMTYNELTDDYVLEIIDFADPEEADDMRELWESQVTKLRRTCGF